MLTACTRAVHTYDEKIFAQTYDAAMGSTIWPLLADIFMTDLEKTLPLDIYIV